MVKCILERERTRVQRDHSRDEKTVAIGRVLIEMNELIRLRRRYRFCYADRGFGICIPAFSQVVSLVGCAALPVGRFVAESDAASRMHLCKGLRVDANAPRASAMEQASSDVTLPVALIVLMMGVLVLSMWGWEKAGRVELSAIHLSGPMVPSVLSRSSSPPTCVPSWLSTHSVTNQEGHTCSKAIKCLIKAHSRQLQWLSSIETGVAPLAQPPTATYLAAIWPFPQGFCMHLKKLQCLALQTIAVFCDLLLFFERATEVPQTRISRIKACSGAAAPRSSDFQF